MQTYSMTQLRCSDYGFDCDFIASGNNENVAIEFSKHSDEVHGISYPIEAVVHIISRKNTK